MKLTVGRCLLAALAMLLVSCASTPPVEVVASPQADFTRFATFTFQKPMGTDREEGTSTILSQTLQRAARAELESLGYEYVEAGADLRVNFFVETRDVIEDLRRPGVSFGYGVFHRGYGVWTGYEPAVRQYTEGTLHVDVVDAGQDRLVWEGITRSRRADGDFAFDLDRARAAVSRVFERFPLRRAGAGG